MTPRATTELDGVYRKIFQRLVPFLMLTATGSLAPGLYVVAAVELCATLLILALVPAFHKQQIGGAALAH